jgi:two-component system invasion response regulator UvrY
MEPPALFDEACSGYDALNMANAVEYDLVLLDISLPDQSGMNVLKQLRHQNQKLPVIILSTHPEDHFAVRTFRAGAAAYVNKGSGGAVLKEAIERVLSGRKYITMSQAELMAEAMDDDRGDTPLHESLSDREYQLACMLAAGNTLTEIAGLLALSVKTASSYRARVLEKLKLRTTADIINYCIQHNLTV